MKNLLFLFIALLFVLPIYAQQETFDIVAYTAPRDWKMEEQNTARVYSRIDGGSWAQIAIYKSTASKGDIDRDMHSEWEAIALALSAVEHDKKTKPETADGWSVMSRSGTWQYNGANVGTILTTFSNGVVCISVLCNATAMTYLKDYQALINSIALNADNTALQTTPLSAQTKSVTNTSSVTIIGLWTSYVNETSGYINGMPQLTGGYFRKEYRFNSDGTYVFLEKDFPAYHNHILFKHETGTWTVNSNQLTLIPEKGKNETWSKAVGNRPDEWGKLLRTENGKLEKTTYTFELKYLSGMDQTYLVLAHNAPTERDGKQSNNGNRQHVWQYSPHELDKSLIDLPSGTRILENK